MSRGEETPGGISLRLNPARGNMYNWITHTANPLGGACPHDCSYCYMKELKEAMPQIAAKYSGPPNLIAKDLKTGHGSGKVIFVCNCADLFAADVPKWNIEEILKHLNDHPDNTYILQSKNPGRFLEWLEKFPPMFILATTLETNRTMHQVNIQTKAPGPKERIKAMSKLQEMGIETMINLEPLAAFDLDAMMIQLLLAKPKYISIGADSSVECKDCSQIFNWQKKRQESCPHCGGRDLKSAHGIVEPEDWKVESLIKRIKARTRAELKLKPNLLRLAWLTSVAELIAEGE